MPKNYGLIPVSKQLHKLIKKRAADEEKPMSLLIQDMWNKYTEAEAKI